VVCAFIELGGAPFPDVPCVPGVWPEHVVILGAPIWLGIAVFGVALGVVAIVGGVSALRRRSFGLSLAGGICALPSVILRILAVIFVSLSKREFEAQK
jgi:hypothetical protein